MSREDDARSGVRRGTGWAPAARTVRRSHFQSLFPPGDCTQGQKGAGRPDTLLGAGHMGFPSGKMAGSLLPGAEGHGQRGRAV